MVCNFMTWNRILSLWHTPRDKTKINILQQNAAAQGPNWEKKSGRTTCIYTTRVWIEKKLYSRIIISKLSKVLGFLQAIFYNRPVQVDVAVDGWARGNENSSGQALTPRSARLLCARVVTTRPLELAADPSGRRASAGRLATAGIGAAPTHPRADAALVS